jgi:hypothetical protein
MNEQTTQINWHELIDKALPLLGVIIGALLTPLVTEKINTIKRKRTVVNELTESLIHFFYAWINYVTEVNYYALYNQMAVKLAEEIEIAFNNGHGQQQMQEKKLIVFNEMELLHRTNGKTHYDERAKAEAKLYALIIEIKHLYGNKRYNALKQLIHPYLKEANTRNANYLYDFLKLSLDQCYEIADELPDKAIFRSGELDSIKVQVLQHSEDIMG